MFHDQGDQVAFHPKRMEKIDHLRSGVYFSQTACASIYRKFLPLVYTCNIYQAPASIGASWSGMQQQHNLHMGTTTMHVSGHVQVACCCCIPLQLAPMDTGAQSS